jgi:3-oxoacyl-[acyl-carrier-protein] synthase-3
VALLTINNVKVNGIATCVPKNTVSNKESSFFNPNESSEFVKTTGINHRRIANEHTNASDLCIAASQKIISDLKWDPNEIEVLVFVTQTPDLPIPGSATRIKEALSLQSSCMALDIHQGCSGYVYGLSVISSLLSHGNVKKGLLLVGDTITKVIDKEDQSVAPLFSDAGSATALSYEPNTPSMYFNLQSDGTGKDFIMQPKNGFMHMNGLKIFSFGLREVVPNIETLLAYARQEIHEQDYVIMHQANKLINESIRKKLNIELSHFPYSLEKYGNTSNATIPTTINHHFRSFELEQSYKICLCGFGVGLLWASALVEFSNITCPEIIEI